MPEGSPGLCVPAGHMHSPGQSAAAQAIHTAAASTAGIGSVVGSWPGHAEPLALSAGTAQSCAASQPSTPGGKMHLLLQNLGLKKISDICEWHVTLEVPCPWWRLSSCSSSQSCTQGLPEQSHCTSDTRNTIQVTATHLGTADAVSNHLRLLFAFPDSR